MSTKEEKALERLFKYAKAYCLIAHPRTSDERKENEVILQSLEEYRDIIAKGLEKKKK